MTERRLTKWGRAGAALALAVAVAVVALLAPPAEAAMTEKQISAKVAKDLGVKVLRVRPGEAGGQAAFLVTIMNPGGNFNAAYQVNTIAVSAESGELVSRVQQRASGLDGNVAPIYDAGRQAADSMQSGVVWR